MGNPAEGSSNPRTRPPAIEFVELFAPTVCIPKGRGEPTVCAQGSRQIRPFLLMGHAIPIGRRVIMRFKRCLKLLTLLSLLLVFGVPIPDWSVFRGVRAAQSRTPAIYVISSGTRQVKGYLAITGAFTSNLIQTGDIGPIIPDGMALRSNGNLFISSPSTNSIIRVGLSTGTIDLNFATSTRLRNPTRLTVGLDQNLYVVSFDTNTVLRFDGESGRLIDTFASVDRPEALVFGPDGNLYVSSSSTNNVLRFNGSTGILMDTFASGSGLNDPKDLVFGPNGDLYVTSFNTDEVKRFDGATGVFIENFVRAGSGGLNSPYGLTFGSDGNLYVSSYATNEVKRYVGMSGAFIDNFVSASDGGLARPTLLVFDPGI